MNMQKMRDTEIAKHAGLILEEYKEDLCYYAWPQGFASTAGPFSSIGGQAYTIFTIEAFVRQDNVAAIYCNGRFLGITMKFTRDFWYSKNTVLDNLPS